MDLSQWFHELLQASTDGFVWGVEQVPGPRRTMLPPAGLGEWTAGRHVFHLLSYEQNIALPAMRQWLSAAIPPMDEFDEEAAWVWEKRSIEKLVVRFKQVRAEDIAMLSKFDDAAWNSTRETRWGSVTLLWVVSKTYQHTTEHINDVLRIALFWDRFAARQAEDDET